MPGAMLVVVATLRSASAAEPAPLPSPLVPAPAAPAALPARGCPPAITVREEVDVAPGFEASASRSTHPFSGATLYDGPPSGLSSLVPDDEKAKGSRLTQTWRFDPTPDRPVFLVCHYAATSAKLTQALPAEVRVCTMSFEWTDRDGRVENPAVPPALACR